jgi:tetratricopeptide (TPR) repeat protein
MFMGRFDELVACADRARQLFEALGDRHRLARLDVNLSQAYTRMDRFDLVLACTGRAIPILREIGDKEGYLAALLNSAIAMTWRHEFESAEERYREALLLATDLGMTALVRLCRYNIAYFEYLGGNAEKALGELDLLRSEYLEIGDDRHICLCWLDEADILLEIGDLEGAIAAARKARSLGVSLKLDAEVGKSLLFEAVASLRLGNTDPAGMLLKDAARRFQSEHNSTGLPSLNCRRRCSRVNRVRLRRFWKPSPPAMPWPAPACRTARLWRTSSSDASSVPTENPIAP